MARRAGRRGEARGGELTPVLVSFDIFGTVVDWRRGLVEACAAVGVPAARAEEAFDAIVDLQGRLEQSSPGRRYGPIVAESVREVLGLDVAAGERVASSIGAWPPYPDSAAALARLGQVAPLAALTNSDRDHGAGVRATLGPGVRFAHWLCAEDTDLYKPDPRAWDACAAATGVAGGPAWWHVSAYADYDLHEASRRGLTTVYVERPHRRPGAATHLVPDLAALADLLGA